MNFFISVILLSFVKSSICTTLFPNESSVLLNIFNTHRANIVGAVKMEVLTWKDYLANSMNTTLARCTANNNNPSHPTFSGPLGRQYYPVVRSYSLYNTSVQLALQNDVDYWYSLSMYYNYEGNACSSVYADDCKTYRAVSESSATEVGCAYQLCQLVDNAVVKGPGPDMFFGCIFNMTFPKQIGVDSPYVKATNVSTSLPTSSTKRSTISPRSDRIPGPVTVILPDNTISRNPVTTTPVRGAAICQGAYSWILTLFLTMSIASLSFT